MKKELSYHEFRTQVEAFKTLMSNSRKGHIEMLILELINEYSPNFMHYKALEMIEEGDFDDDMAVRGHFKRILWHEVAMEAEAERIQLQPYHKESIKITSDHVFQLDEENIENLNQSTFLDKHPNWAPLQLGAAQRYFDEQMANQSQ